MKGRVLAGSSKVFAGAFVISLFAGKMAGLFLVSGIDILKVASFYVLLFSPVDVSFWLVNLLRPEQPDDTTYKINHGLFKQASLVSKLLGGVFVTLSFALYTTRTISQQLTTIDEILSAGVFLALLFSPVDVSLWLEKWRQRTKKGLGL